MASSCAFGDLLDELILYRIVDGIRSDLVRDRILRSPEDDMTLSQAITICRDSELSQISMQHFSGVDTTKEVDTIARRGMGSSNVRTGKVANQVELCTRCGRRHVA